MCIVCNAGDMGIAFLDAHRIAADYMRQAEDLMRVCALRQQDPQVRARYDRTHKRLNQLRRAWNRTERERESPPVAPPPVHDDDTGHQELGA